MDMFYKTLLHDYEQIKNYVIVRHEAICTLPAVSFHFKITDCFPEESGQAVPRNDATCSTVQECDATMMSKAIQPGQ